MLIEAWLAFAAASIAVSVIPGPTVLLVVSMALRHGRGLAGAMTAGVAAGDLAAMTAALAGVGALMQASAAAFTALKLAGAAYLAWMGFKLLRAPAADLKGLSGAAAADAAPADKSLTPAAAFNRAFWVTALNPKSILFFVALTPQFANAAAPYAPQAALMTVTFVAIGACNAMAYALAAQRLRARLTPGGVRRLSQFGGGALIALAGFAAFGSPRPDA